MRRYPTSHSFPLVEGIGGGSGKKEASEGKNIHNMSFPSTLCWGNHHSHFQGGKPSQETEEEKPSLRVLMEPVCQQCLKPACFLKSLIRQYTLPPAFFFFF